MTCLQRTDLTTSQQIQCAAQALGRQAPGVISGLSVEFGLSRPTVYEAAATAEAILARHFQQGTLETVTVVVDEAQLRRAIIALRVVAPNSIRALEELIPLLYPGQRLSYGKIQQWLVEAEGRARCFNAQVPLAGIRAGALDELFSPGEPVLAGIDLDSGYLFALAVGEDRSAATWAQLLRQGQAQGLDLEVVVKDAAQGIAAGVNAVFPAAEQRDDCFHAHYELGKVRQRLERRAYAAIQREQDVRDTLGRTPAKERQRRRQLKQQLAWARRKCHPAIADYDAFAAAVDQAQAAMSWVDLDTGQLRGAAQLRTEIVQAAQALRAVDYRGCRKVANYLTNRAPGLAAYAAQLKTQFDALTPVYGEEAMSLAAVIIQVRDDLQQHRRPWHHREQSQHLLGAYHHLRQQLGDQADCLLEQVQQLWQQRHRASSAIEGFNSSLRPYLYGHKGVSAGFLELYQAYYNLRTRRWGRHKNTSAYQSLTGHTIDDWLTLLGFSPSHAVH
jgi:hypothetical protein